MTVTTSYHSQDLNEYAAPFFPKPFQLTTHQLNVHAPEFRPTQKPIHQQSKTPKTIHQNLIKITPPKIGIGNPQSQHALVQTPITLNPEIHYKNAQTQSIFSPETIKKLQQSSSISSSSHISKPPVQSQQHSDSTIRDGKQPVFSDGQSTINFPSNSNGSGGSGLVEQSQFFDTCLLLADTQLTQPLLINKDSISLLKDSQTQTEEINNDEEFKRKQLPDIQTTIKDLSPITQKCIRKRIRKNTKRASKKLLINIERDIHRLTKKKI